MNKIAQWALNISVGIFFFVFFLFIFFPFESLIQDFLGRIEKESGGVYRVTVGEIEPNIVFKSVFKDFQVHQQKDGKSEILIDFPKVKVGVRYIPLMMGNLEASFVAYGHTEKKNKKEKPGLLEGKVFLSKTESRIRSKFQKLKLSDIPALAQWTKVSIEGQITGELEAHLYPAQWNNNTGKINLAIEKAKILANRITPYPGFDLDLPETFLAEKEPASIQMVLDKGKLTIHKVFFPGEDVMMDVSGSIRFNPRLSLSRINLSGNFKLSEKIEKVIPLIVVIEKQKNEQGGYPISLSGRLSKPTIQIGTFNVF